MKYIDIHSHMTSRTTNDYEDMAMTGCVALSEPAFWAGYDRTSGDAFKDYFEHLTTFEPARALQYGIKHFTWLCLNPKESDNRELAAQVLPLISHFLDRPNVIGIGEAGVNRVTHNELQTFAEHVELAARNNLMMQVHTPHLEDKHKGTKAILDILKDEKRIQPGRVLIDHVEEHTIEKVLEAGFWAGISLYPQTKVSSDRAIDMIELYGSAHICVASACDWGPSVPMAVPQFVMQMRRRGYGDKVIERVVFENPRQFLSQSTKFQL